MAKGKETKTAAHVQAKIYEVATLQWGTGRVVRHTDEITETQAIGLRKAGKDVVVCGDDIVVNRTVAERIETAAHGSCLAERPHKNAGPHALPHFQPETRPPMGHTFFETGKNKKAKKVQK
ncbi:MAG: hypothetical protein K8T91_13625 [Planctomycetes bacterium]|nr:hypothetical protein [Planctomycetota bacterium]